MASPVRRRLIQRTSNNVASLPAPVGGWNARDALANMAPTDAVTLDNLFPGVSSVMLRGGYIRHATGISGHVSSKKCVSTAHNVSRPRIDAPCWIAAALPLSCEYN